MNLLFMKIYNERNSCSANNLPHRLFQKLPYYNYVSVCLWFLTTCSNSLIWLHVSVILGRRYGTKCGGCAQGISPSDLVRKARSKVFHLNCFTCIMCNKQLSTGEELYVLDEHKFVCKEDYINNSIGKDTNLPSSESFWTLKA